MYQERGRPPKPPWQSVTGCRHALDPAAWAHVTVRDGEKGPVGIELVTRRVQTRLERKRTGPDEWLVVTRCPLADKGTFEFIPLSFWYDTPLTSPYRDRRHDPWQVYGSPSCSPVRWRSWISRA